MSAAVEQSRRKANMVAQGEGPFQVFPIEIYVNDSNYSSKHTFIGNIICTLVSYIKIIEISVHCIAVT